MDVLVTIHSLVRWLVIAGLVGGIVVAFAAARRPGEAFANPVYSAIAIVLDIEVTIGLILWLFDNGWDQNAFMAWVHPIVMLIALGVLHMSIARGRKRASTSHAEGNRIVAIGMLISFVLIVSVIPWGRL